LNHLFVVNTEGKGVFGVYDKSERALKHLLIYKVSGSEVDFTFD
jgi:hypothetical protein